MDHPERLASVVKSCSVPGTRCLLLNSCDPNLQMRGLRLRKEVTAQSATKATPQSIGYPEWWPEESGDSAFQNESGLKSGSTISLLRGLLKVTKSL